MIGITFTVPGQPVAKGRPKFRNVHTKAGQSFTTTYTPAKTRNFETLVKEIAASAMAGRPPLNAPLALRVELGLQIPMSWSKKKQEKARAGIVRATKKPDGDNCLKAVKDACNGIVWRDDSMVVRATVEKRYAETPGARVHVLVMDGECA